MTRNELTKLWAKVTGKFNALIGGAPEALDTLKEIADKLGDNDDALAGLLTQVGGKQDALVSGQNIKTLNNESLLGGGNVTIKPSDLTFTITQSGTTYTADKTFAEIQAAIRSGATVMGAFDYGGYMVLLSLVGQSVDSIIFAALNGSQVIAFLISASAVTLVDKNLIDSDELATVTGVRVAANWITTAMLGSMYAVTGYDSQALVNAYNANRYIQLTFNGGEWGGVTCFCGGYYIDGSDKVFVFTAWQSANLLFVELYPSGVVSVTALNVAAKADKNDVDDVPTAGSEKFVKSGGVFDELVLGAVYDVSAKNPTAGINNDGKWESLSALLSDANLNTLIPGSVRKGGMSIKFVQSSDNKYVQYRLKSNTFSTDTEDWEDESTEVQFHVMVEALAYLYNENKALHELLTGKDNAVLPYIKAQTIECVDKMTMGVPDVLESNVAGAPSAANVPDNWNEATMNVWDGCPRRIGQQYVDKASGKVYYAIKVTGSTANWVALN